MRGAEHVQALIKECKKNGNIGKGIVKGLSEVELRQLIDAIVPGGITNKAIVFADLREKL